MLLFLCPKCGHSDVIFQGREGDLAAFSIDPDRFVAALTHPSHLPIRPTLCPGGLSGVKAISTTIPTNALHHDRQSNELAWPDACFDGTQLFGCLCRILP